MTINTGITSPVQESAVNIAPSMIINGVHWEGDTTTADAVNNTGITSPGQESAVNITSAVITSPGPEPEGAVNSTPIMITNSVDYTGPAGAVSNSVDWEGADTANSTSGMNGMEIRLGHMCLIFIILHVFWSKKVKRDSKNTPASEWRLRSLLNADNG